MATNITPATATLLVPGVDITQADFAGGTDLWFTYSPGASDTGFGFWASLSSGTSDVSVYVGIPAALTDLVTGTNPWTFSQNAPIQIPITGPDVFFKVTPDTGSTLTVSPVLGPTDPIPAGAIFINDDTPEYPAVIRDPGTGDVLKIQPTIAAGEAGDALATGLVVLYDFDDDTVKVYEQATAFSLLATLVPTGSGDRLIRTNPALDRAYVLSHGAANTAKIQYIDNAGALNGTVHSGARTGTQTGFATSPDGTLAYYAQSGGAIKVLRLADDVQLADLVAAPGDGTLSWDILVLPTGDLLVTRYRYGITGVKVHRYDNTGVEQDVYDFGDTWHGPGGGTPPRTAYAPDAGQFWIMLHPDAPLDGYTTFKRVQVSDGTVLLSFDQIEYELGVYNQPSTELAPVARFGTSFSCPLVVLREGVTVGTIIVTKITDPPDSPQTFDFTIDNGAEPAAFALGNGESEEFTDIPTGVYAIAEGTLPDGWTLTSVVVSSGDPISAIDLGDGETITVTVTNTFQSCTGERGDPPIGA